ncbi:hypothetical protein CARUB_v10025473mg, partial [Capsella rubella]
MDLLSNDPETQGYQGICALPDDLLWLILLRVPAKDGAATAILSKRWRYMWQMLYKLAFKDDQGSESFGWFIDKSLQLHRAPKLVSLVVELGPPCPVDVDVRKWVDKAVNHGVKKLDFKLLWTGEPTSFPKSLYTCDSLITLTLSDQILVDVSFPASLPSLLYLNLFNVVYKDEESLARLLSSSPLLLQLQVKRRDEDDNLTNFTVKVPSLKKFIYESKRLKKEEEEDHTGSLVVDSPALTVLNIADFRRDYCSVIENLFCLDTAFIEIVLYPDENFLRCLSSARRLFLKLSESMVACCNSVKFSRLTDLIVISRAPVYWLQPLMFLLQNSPKLKNLAICNTGCPPSSWNRPSTVPQCISSHLEIVRVINYEGREDAKQLMTYILANSNCLKTVEISFRATCNLEECQKELEAMPRISASSRFLF